MNETSNLSTHPTQNGTLGDRIRSIAQQLRQESDIQIKATSRILGAAAQLAQNHDRLIDEVVEMVEEDLAQAEAIPVAEAPQYTLEQLKKQFKTLPQAKAHFNLKASSWAALVDKLNERSPGSTAAATNSPDLSSQKLASIEQEIQSMRKDLQAVEQLLVLILEKLS